MELYTLLPPGFIPAAIKARIPVWGKMAYNPLAIMLFTHQARPFQEPGRKIRIAQGQLINSQSTVIISVLDAVRNQLEETATVDL